MTGSAEVRDPQAVDVLRAPPFAEAAGDPYVRGRRRPNLSRHSAGFCADALATGIGEPAELITTCARRPILSLAEGGDGAVGGRANHRSVDGPPAPSATAHVAPSSGTPRGE